MYHCNLHGWTYSGYACAICHTNHTVHSWTDVNSGANPGENIKLESHVKRLDNFMEKDQKEECEKKVIIYFLRNLIAKFESMDTNEISEFLGDALK